MADSANITSNVTTGVSLTAGTTTGVSIASTVTQGTSVTGTVATGGVGPTGATGAAGSNGQGVPVGGTTGQVLAKVNGTDYNTEWVANGLANVVEDATPQLGGDLDLNGNKIAHGSNLLLFGNGFNTLFRPDSSGGEIQFQNYAGSNNSRFYDNGNVSVAGDISAANLSGTNTGDQDLSGYATKTGSETLTNKTITQPTLSLKQSANPTPTGEGEIEWDTDDNRLRIGTGASYKEVVNTDNTQTLTNKTISGSSNTLSNIGISSLSATGTPSASTYLRGDGSWATPSGSGGISRSIVVTSGNVTAGATASTDYVYLVAGAHTITLPTAVSNTNRYSIKNNHSAAITVDTTSSQTIDGTTTIQIAPEDSVDIISNNTNWNIL